MIYTVYNDNLIRYNFLLVFKRIQERWKQLRLQTCMNRGLVCKAGRMFTYQSKCIYVTKKRLMHFHFENGINNPIPKLSDLKSCKDLNPITFDDQIVWKKLKTLDIVIECQGQLIVKLVCNFLLWSVQQWLANICVGDRELHRHLLY